ncbi:aldehyde reductase [Prochlorococcus sp. MIT 1307]|uniref:SDR family oxidoreductase n=1 Tax=Prochlorococcus sp. MIT 1307 TaxID=3096219 RepID=UPI002A754EDC|nr:aldehyde reductase [Prochlorococcus sp. MIT 1307]
MKINQEKVLVTGASGYIALHCIAELLKKGYRVKGSLRDLNRQDEVRKSLALEAEYEKLEFCKLNLLDNQGWEAAASDCDYLLHIASPCSIEEPTNEKQLIKPALKGTLSALKAAQKSNVKKVVLTSSIGAIAYGHSKSTCDPTDWTDTSKDVGAYIKSKTIAEKAAWDFMTNQSDTSFTMTTIHPGMVFGPLLSNAIEGMSAGLITKMISGKFLALPDIYFTVVDVRDIAKLHVESITNKQSDHKRIIATSQQAISFLEISKILRELGFNKSPQNRIPTQLINSLAIFNIGMKNTASMIKRGCYSVDTSETISLYDWDPIPFKKTLKDMTKSLKTMS